VKLSVCIPTHKGRCAVLREALDSIAAQAAGDLPLELELCISDNASQDGTEAMVAAFAAVHPGLRIRYERNERDIGLANILRVVERATGDWCWLFGSDDVMAEDGLRRVMGAIARFPDATGIGFERANFSNDMRERLEGDVAEGLPVWRETRVLTDPDEIVVELTFIHMVMACNVVRRERWLEAAEQQEELALSHRDWPQLVILETMARAHPEWVWLPAWLVKARTGTPYLVEHGQVGDDLARIHVRLVDGMRKVWGDMAGRGTPLYRALMTKGYLTMGSSATVAHLKDRPAHDLRADLALLVTFTRAFWWLDTFRRHALPRLLLPAPLWRALRRRQAARQGPPMSVLEPSAVRTALTCDVPDTFYARDSPRLVCRLYNAGPVDLRSTEPHPVNVGYRWVGTDGEVVLEGQRTALRRPLAPRGEAELTLRLRTPWTPGTYELRISPVQELVAWFDDLDPANGVRATVSVADTD
jgi:abequosyltransferase